MAENLGFSITYLDRADWPSDPTWGALALDFSRRTDLSPDVHETARRVGQLERTDQPTMADVRAFPAMARLAAAEIAALAESGGGDVYAAMPNQVAVAAGYLLARSYKIDRSRIRLMHYDQATRAYIPVPLAPGHSFTSTSSRMRRQSLASTICCWKRCRSDRHAPIT